MRHGNGRFLMATSDELRAMVAAVVDDGFMQATEAGAGIGEDIVESDGLENVHHEIGTGMVRSEHLDAGRGIVFLWNHGGGGRARGFLLLRGRRL
jgi:hypothetical protein